MRGITRSQSSLAFPKQCHADVGADCCHYFILDDDESKILRMCGDCPCSRGMDVYE